MPDLSPEAVMPRIPKVVGQRLRVNDGWSLFCKAVVKALPAPAWKDPSGIRFRKLQQRAKCLTGSEDRLRRAFAEFDQEAA